MGGGGRSGGKWETSVIVLTIKKFLKGSSHWVGLKIGDKNICRVSSLDAL